MSMFRKVFKPMDDRDKANREAGVQNIEYKRTIDPLFRDPCGKGQLHILLEHGYDTPDDIEYVVSRGCDINTGDNDNNYPIHIAVTRQLNKCVKKLIQRNSLLDVFNKSDVTPLMIAARKGHADNLYNLVQNGANPNLANKQKLSAMHCAAIGGDVRCMKLLLEARGKVNHQDVQGFTPIILAAKHGHLETVKCLLQHKTFPKINPNKQDNCKRTALHWAVEDGHIEVVRFLLEEKVDTDVMDTYGDVPYGRAVKNNHADILRLLMERGCETGMYDGWNGTGVGLTALFGFNESLQVLLEAGECPDEIAYFGIRPIMSAVFESRVETVRILIAAGANVNKLGRNGTQALTLAFLSLGSRNEVARHDIVRLLLRAGANVHVSLAPTLGQWTQCLGNLTYGRYDMLSFAMLSGYISMTTMLLCAGSVVTHSDIEVLSSNLFLTHGFRVAADMLEYLKNWVAQPRSLKMLARNCVRQRIPFQTESNINKLTIATPLKRYLNLEELDYISLERSVNVNVPVTISASSFVCVTPCMLRHLDGSMLHDTLLPTLNKCTCPYCRRYEDNLTE